VEAHFERGEYIIFTEIDSKNNDGLTVSCYSRHPVPISNADLFIDTIDT